MSLPFNLSDIILRQLSDPNYSTKNSELTWIELDKNIKLLADAIASLSIPDAPGVVPYSPSEEYSDGDVVSYDGNIWLFVNPVPQTGITPGTDELTWELSSTGIFAHVQNTDQYLDYGGPNEVSAADVKNAIGLVDEKISLDGSSPETTGLIKLGENQGFAQIDSGTSQSVISTATSGIVNAAVSDSENSVGTVQYINKDGSYSLEMGNGTDSAKIDANEDEVKLSVKEDSGATTVAEVSVTRDGVEITSGGFTQTMPSSSGQLVNDTDLSATLGDYQSKAIVVSGNTTAVNDGVYHNVASATYTDPTPVEGKGFTVLVINGTATVGGTGYSTAGAIIVRRYHSGSWANLVYNDKAINDSLYLSLGGGTLTGALTAPSFTINGTAGNGFMSLINQSSNPSAVSGTIRLFADSSANLTWVRRNNANSANIRRTLIMPDQDIDYTFPTPASGTASTLAGLNTGQTFTQTNTFSALQKIASVQILDNDGTTWRTFVDSVLNGQIRINAGNASVPLLINSAVTQFAGSIRTGAVQTHTGSLSIGVGVNGLLNIITNDQNSANAGGIYIRTGSQTASLALANSGSISIITGSVTNGGALSSQASSSVKLDSGTVAGSATRGGVVFFNGDTEPNWQGLQRGIFIGNATAVPTGNPTGGGFLYAEGGALKWRGSSGTVTTIATA